MANQFTIGVVNVSMKHEAVSIRDIPARGMPEEEATAAQPAIFETVDGWMGHFGFFEFPSAGIIVGKFHWHRDPLMPPYDRLKNAGSTTVTRVGDRWVCPVRAMKIKGKPWPTLCSVTEEELDSLVGGSFEELVNSIGDVTMDTFRSLNPNAGKNVANALGLSVPAGAVEPLLAMIAVTRPLALIKKLGAS
jgi:hypothetical protein